MAKRKTPRRGRPARKPTRRASAKPTVKSTRTSSRRTTARPAAPSRRRPTPPRAKPTVSRPPARPSRAVRPPRPPRATSRRRRFRLRTLTAERKKAVDALLVRVYRHAARELAELEEQRVLELRKRDAELARAYATARAELMRCLAQWEADRPATPPPDEVPTDR